MIGAGWPAICLRGSTTMIGAQFSDEDFETLSDWLGRRDKGIADIVELEGFLTAVIIGPNTLSPAL